MSNISEKKLESSYERHILPQFSVVFNKVIWHGHGTLDNSSSLHYFISNGDDYVLLCEETPLVNISTSKDDIIPPYQTLVEIPPTDTAYPDVYFTLKDSSNTDTTGYFRLFRITDNR